MSKPSKPKPLTPEQTADLRRKVQTMVDRLQGRLNVLHRHLADRRTIPGQALGSALLRLAASLHKLGQAEELIRPAVPRMNTRGMDE